MKLTRGFKKRILSFWLPICLFCLILSIWGRSRGTPPTDDKLVKQFYQHKREFEKLLTMLQEDPMITAVAGWGVKSDSAGTNSPGEISFPRQRYEEYLVTLKEAGAAVAIHDVRQHEFRFPVAGFGFGGEGWRISCAWREYEPEHLVSNLYDFHKAHGRPGDCVYRHIEGNWYLMLSEGL